MGKFIELSNQNEKFLVNTKNITYVEKDGDSKAVVHFNHSKPDSVAILYVEQSYDQVKQLIFE